MTTTFRQIRQAVLADPAGFATPPAVTTDRVVGLGYDADGRLGTRTTYNNGTSTPHNTVTTYDAVGRVDTVTDPSGSFTDENYATNGRLSQRTVNDGLGNRVFTFGYDGHDRVNQQTALGTPNLVTDFGYDGLDRQTSITDPKNIMTVTQYDLAGRRTGLVEDNGGAKQRQTAFAYNRLGQLITQTAENKTSGGGGLANQVTTFRHDTMGRQTRIVYPDSGQAPDSCTDCVQMGYDYAGRMTSRTDQRGLATAYDYDGRGLLLTRTTGATVDSFTYDGVARLSTADRGSNAIDLFYTGLGDLDYEVQTIAGGTSRTVDSGYDQAGNRTSLVYPSGETLGYVPTAIDQVASATLNGNTFLNYSYLGRMLDKRRTTTNAPGGTTRYDYQLGYDSHHRINATDNSLDVNGTPTNLASFAFTHDDNGNPATQTGTGLDGFAGDDRIFTVDTLDRLIATIYSNGSDSMTLDLVGNRESYTNRAGGTTAYTLANPGNEYATIGGNVVAYDAAGNLTLDEQGRHYDYDERNRLTQIRAADNTTVLADYTYDALGRRVISVINGVTTRYYYDGQNVIEERNGADARVRYHVNGSQYIDERVATYEDGAALNKPRAQVEEPPRWATGAGLESPDSPGAPGFTYYLLKENYSVAGTGNADGSTITRSDYSSTGDFAGAGGGIDVDYDHDEDVDAADFAAFAACDSGPNVPQNTPSCADKKLDFDSDVDQDDFGVFQECFSGAGNPAPPECTGQGPTVASGDFVMHGRPVDVLADGHALLYVRARYYDLRNGRWLQRDGLDYADGPNLYEAFGGNPLRFQDAFGTEIIKDVDKLSYDQIKERKWEDVLETLFASERNLIPINNDTRKFLVVTLMKKNEEGFDWYKLGWNAVKFSGKDPSRMSDIDLMAVGHNITMQLSQKVVLADTKRIQAFAGAVFILASNAVVMATTGPFVGALGGAVFGGGPELGAGAGLVRAGTAVRGPAASAAEEVFITVPRGTPPGFLQPRLQFNTPLPYDLPGGPGGASRLIHLTNAEGKAEILSSGNLIGNRGIFAVPESVARESTAWKVARTGLMPGKTTTFVRVPEAATGLFQRPVPIGPYSAWKYLGGVRYAPPGSINTATGVFTPSGAIIGPRALIYGPDVVIFYPFVVAEGGLYIQEKAQGE